MEFDFRWRLWLSLRQVGAELLEFVTTMDNNGAKDGMDEAAIEELAVIGTEENVIN